MLDSIFKLSYDNKITLKWHFFSMKTLKCVYMYAELLWTPLHKVTKFVNH